MVCTGFANGEPCIAGLLPDSGLALITLSPQNSDDTRFLVSWTGGEAYTRFVLVGPKIDPLTDRVVVDNFRVPYDCPQPVFVGEDLVFGREYRLYYRTENATHHSIWQYQWWPFTGVTLGLMADGEDLIIDGVTPDYLVENLGVPVFYKPAAIEFEIVEDTPDPIPQLSFYTLNSATWDVDCEVYRIYDEAPANVVSPVGLTRTMVVGMCLNSVTDIQRIYASGNYLKTIIPNLNTWTGLTHFVNQYGHFYGNVPSFANQANLVTVGLKYNDLTGYVGGGFTSAGPVTFDVSNNKLPTSAVSEILTDADAAGWGAGTTINLTGYGMGVPNQAGALAAQNLRGRGATVTFETEPILLQEFGDTNLAVTFRGEGIWSYSDLTESWIHIADWDGILMTNMDGNLVASNQENGVQEWNGVTWTQLAGAGFQPHLMLQGDPDSRDLWCEFVEPTSVIRIWQYSGTGTSWNMRTAYNMGLYQVATVSPGGFIAAIGPGPNPDPTDLSLWEYDGTWSQRSNWADSLALIETGIGTNRVIVTGFQVDDFRVWQMTPPQTWIKISNDRAENLIDFNGSPVGYFPDTQVIKKYRDVASGWIALTSESVFEMTSFGILDGDLCAIYNGFLRKYSGTNVRWFDMDLPSF